MFKCTDSSIVGHKTKINLIGYNTEYINSWRMEEKIMSVSVMIFEEQLLALFCLPSGLMNQSTKQSTIFYVNSRLTSLQWIYKVKNKFTGTSFKRNFQKS